MTVVLQGWWELGLELELESELELELERGQFDLFLLVLVVILMDERLMWVKKDETFHQHLQFVSTYR